MMKYFKFNGDMYAYEADGSQDHLITNDHIEMTTEEIDQHINPEKYLRDEERIQLAREYMPTLTPIEFDIKLVAAGLYNQVQELISKDIKLKIAYTRATFFSRTDPFIDQARIALNLTDEQVDTIWESPLV